jgi:hypothetical protein
MLKLNINVAVKVFAISVALPMLSGIATKIYWYLQMRTGVEGPYFLYYSGSLRTAFLIYLASPILFIVLIWAVNQSAAIRKCLLSPRIRYSTLWLGLIIAIAFVLRIITVLNVDHTPPQQPYVGDQGCYYGSALDFMAGEHPMLFFSRGHIGLLWAPLFMLFENNVLAALLLNVVTSTLTVYLVYRITTMVSGKTCMGLIAAGLLAVFPSHVILCRVLITESTFTFFMVFALFWLIRFGVMSSLPQYWISRRWILDISLCGINLGICHWLRPLAVLVWLVAIVWLIIIVNRKMGLSLRRSLIAIVVLSVIFYSSIVWLMLANYRFQGEFSPSYMEGRGLVFLAGTLKQQRGDTLNNMDRFEEIGKLQSEELSRKNVLPISMYGHKEVQGILAKAAWRRILDSPVEFLSMAATEKMCKLWTPPIMGDNPVKILNSVFFPGAILNSFLISFTALSALSLFVCGIEDRRAMLLVLALMLVTACSACHFMFDSMARYRFYCAPWLIIFITLSMQIISNKFGKHLIIPSNVKDRGYPATNGKA